MEPRTLERELTWENLGFRAAKRFPPASCDHVLDELEKRFVLASRHEVEPNLLVLASRPAAAQPSDGSARPGQPPPTTAPTTAAMRSVEPAL